MPGDAVQPDPVVEHGECLWGLAVGASGTDGASRFPPYGLGSEDLMRVQTRIVALRDIRGRVSAGLEYLVVGDLSLNVACVRLGQLLVAAEGDDAHPLVVSRHVIYFNTYERIVRIHSIFCPAVVKP